MLKGSKKNKNAEKKDASPSDPKNRIAEAAYFLAESRGFEPGRELEDWVAAENIIATESIEATQAQ